MGCTCVNTLRLQDRYFAALMRHYSAINRLPDLGLLYIKSIRAFLKDNQDNINNKNPALITKKKPKLILKSKA